MDTTEKRLCAELETWCGEQGLPFLSADELVCELEYARASTNDPDEIGRITLQLRWLGEFIQRWETWEKGQAATRPSQDIQQ